MKLTSVFLLVGLLAVYGCSSSKKSVPVPEAKREYKHEYVIVGASSDVFPEWVEDPASWDTGADKKTHRYFVNESNHTNKRLCLRSAEARATARIAQEIAQFMKNSYSEATQGDDDDVTQYMQEQLATEAQAFVIGASVFQTYWEERSYKVELGASEDMKKFACYALVKMSKKSLEKAVKSATDKLLNGLADPEVKKKTDDALKDVEKKFSEHDKKVEVEATEAE